MPKCIVLLLIIFSIPGHSQSKEEIAAKDFFWGVNDPSKKAVDIPEKWKNESAVIIYKNINYDFHSFSKRVTYVNSIRKRIKLLDKAAVEEFSEFTFTKRFRSSKGRFSWKQKGTTFVGVKVVKPNGLEVVIDVEKDAVTIDNETKLAISNLEVGDIIDYYYHRIEPFKSTSAFGFEPVETSLTEEYPIMDFKLYFETENDFFINFNSYNNAPILKQIPSEKKSVRRYELTEKNIDKSEYIRWFYPLLEFPSYKFQVYFARSGKFENRALAFLPEDEDLIKTSVTQKEVLNLYDNRFKPDGYVGDLKKFFKNKTFDDDAHKVTAAFYYMRHYYLTRFIEGFFAKEANISNFPFAGYGNNIVFIKNEKQFIRHFTAFLKGEKIGYEIVIGQKRYDGPVEDLLIEQNVNVLVKVNTENPLYASYFGPHTTINEFPALLENTDVYLLSASKNRIDDIKTGKLPKSTYRDNETKKDINVTINDDFSELTLTAVNSFKGHEKGNQQYDRLLYSDYVNEDYKKYDTASWVDFFRVEKYKTKYSKELKALNDKLKIKQKEWFKESAQAEYGCENIEDYTYSIDSNGRFSLDSYFTFTESFNAKNALIRKAGPNYIIEIGKLIGGQIDLTDNERVRTKNIYMPYPRSFNYNIVLNIPNGYTVSGLDKLNKSIDNETGAFISTAKLDGNQLIITTSKQYKNYYEPNTNWNKMISFLDEANQFTNEKILLKKG
jgi:hypothetical protein